MYGAQAMPKKTVLMRPLFTGYVMRSPNHDALTTQMMATISLKREIIFKKPL